MDPLQISILAAKKILINIGSSELMKSFEQGNEKIAHVNVSTKQGETSSYDKIRNTILLQKKLKDDLYEQALAKQKRANEENIDSSIAIARMVSQQQSAGLIVANKNKKAKSKKRLAKRAKR